MKKSINNTADLQEVFDRLGKLTPESKGLWGKMNVKQMLRHISDAANFAFETPNPNTKRRGVMLWMILNIPAPKNAKTYPDLDMVANKVDPEEFEKERQRVKEIFGKVSAEKGPFKTNPFLGPLTKDEWGKLCFVHANHHCKQFGV